ncbi:hypothetical protein ABW20_dc0101994 [Dactylellina cionopaga]|nr:hypothetical protein ABW20_dc0101994 [Dactylellina cionopaga]
MQQIQHGHDKGTPLLGPLVTSNTPNSDADSILSSDSSSLNIRRRGRKYKPEESPSPDSERDSPPPPTKPAKAVRKAARLPPAIVPPLVKKPAPFKNQSKAKRRQRWREKLAVEESKSQHSASGLQNTSSSQPDKKPAVDLLPKLPPHGSRYTLSSSVSNWLEQDAATGPWSSVIVAEEYDRNESRDRREARVRSVSEEVDTAMKGLEGYLETLERVKNEWC